MAVPLRRERAGLKPTVGTGFPVVGRRVVLKFENI
jgi:hypothetical protein